MTQPTMDRYLTRLLALVITACVLAPCVAGAFSGGLLFPSPARGAATAAQPWDVEVVQTSADLTQHLTRLSDLRFGTMPSSGAPVIHVDDQARYQRVTGIGASMTDASAWLIGDTLGPSARGALMTQLFSAAGIHLNFILVPMGASDFTRDGRPYTYDDRPAGQSDPQLLHFSIAHDRAYIIPLLRTVLTINPQAEMLAVPWTPPAWMKANHSLNNLGHGGTLLPSAYPALAQYFVKFIQAYAREGIPIGEIAPENEPHAPAGYPSMDLPVPAEAKWILQDLKPALAAANLQTSIYGSDTAWGNPQYTPDLVATQALGALSGVAWHCYSGTPYVMSALHQQLPGLDQIVTECSPGITPYSASEVVIGSLRNWASAVGLWNVALNQSGGPVQPPDSGCGGCTGVVTVNDQTHKVTYSREYYQLGQVSKFVQSGAWRIGSEHFVSYGNHGVSSGLDDVAVRNPNGSRVLVAYNSSAAPFRFTVQWNGRSFTYTLPSKATVTLAWNRPGAVLAPAVAVNTQTDHAYTFWQSGDGYLNEAWFNGTRWRGPVKLTSWGATASAPALAVAKDGRQFVFWRATNNDLYEAWYDNGRWNGPRNMTTVYGWGMGSSTPAVAVNPTTDGQYVFWRDTRGHIHEAWYDNHWHPPTDMGWQSSSGPSAAVGDDSHQYVLWRAANGDIWEAWHTTTWHGPQDMTTTHKWGQTASTPTVAVNPTSDHQYVFWRAPNGDIDQGYINGTGWHGPSDMTVRYGWGRALSAPGVAVSNDGSQYVFWQSTNMDIWEATYHSGWSSGQDLLVP